MCIEPWTVSQLNAIEQWMKERERDLEQVPQRGLLPSCGPGWQCPNCGKAHAPNVPTCPETPRAK